MPHMSIYIGSPASTWLERRVPGLPIRNYAGSCNSSVHMCTHVNAIHVTAKNIFERLCFVPELGTFGP